jgi:hypothetical protein
VIVITRSNNRLKKFRQTRTILKESDRRWHNIARISQVVVAAFGDRTGLMIKHNILIQKQRVASLVNAKNIIRIDDEDQSLCAVAVMSPEWPKPFLTADIPYIHVEPFVANRLNIETDRWDRRHLFPKCQFVQQRRLPGGIKSEHQAARVSIAEPFPGQS